MQNRPKLNVGKEHFKNFGVEHYRHRYFNEIPSIQKQLVEINQRNNEVAMLLDNKELFTPVPEDHINIKRTTFTTVPEKGIAHDTPKENFTVKKRVTLKNIIDKILTIILAIVFIIFAGKMIQICFFDKDSKDKKHSM